MTMISLVLSPRVTNKLLRCSIATASRPLAMPLEEFRDQLSRTDRMKENVGRPWSVTELRRKSYDDLHKLWYVGRNIVKFHDYTILYYIQPLLSPTPFIHCRYVLYKEKNMLLTEVNLSRRRTIPMPQPERRLKVKKGMAAIKCVLGERKRAAIQAHAVKVKTLAERNYSNREMNVFDFNHEAKDEFDDELVDGEDGGIGNDDYDINDDNDEDDDDNYNDDEEDDDDDNNDDDDDDDDDTPNKK